MNGWRQRATLAALGALLALHVGLAVGQIPGHSPAADEPIHIAAGYRLWLTGDSIDQTHPPLAKLALALPLLAMRADPIVGDSTGEALQRFLLENRVPRERMLAGPRAVGVAFSAALVLVAFLWSRRLWGAGGGLVTAAALALCPLLLADAPIAGNDVACALTFALALLTFGRYLRDPGPRPLALFALCFAAAQATKFSAILLVPICAGLYLGKRLLERRARGARPGVSSSGPAGVPASGADGGEAQDLARGTAPGLRRALRDALIVAGATALFVWATYGFEVQSLAGDRELALHPRAGAVRDAMAQLPAWLRELPVPAYSFVKGFALQSFHAANQSTWTGGYNHQFLFGENRPDGWWYYFPLALTVKAPLPFLGLLGWALVALRRRRATGTAAAAGSVGAAAPAVDPFEFLLLALPAGLWLATCMLLTINIGIRYLLPMIPLLAILMGALGPAIGRRRLPLAIAAILLAWQAAGTLRAYPHVHAYFNEVAGGPAGGWRYLNNSSIDWGQDLPALDRYLKDRAIDRIGDADVAPGAGDTAASDAVPYLDYFGGIDPRAWGIRYRPLPDPNSEEPLSGLLIVSQSRLTARGPHEPLYRRLRAQRPTAQLGWTLFVYDLELPLATAAPPVRGR